MSEANQETLSEEQLSGTDEVESACDTSPTPTSPVRPNIPAVGDLQMFQLITKAIPTDEVSQQAPVVLAAPAALEPVSIRSAWQNFINPTTNQNQSPPPKRRCERSVVPSSFLTDAAVTTTFRHPWNATPPPRLAAFALPASLPPELHDTPQDVCFTLTLADGSRVHGSALQTCEEVEGGQAVVLRALVVLSKWPVQELWRTMLHTIFSRGDAPLAGCSPSRGAVQTPSTASDSEAHAVETLSETLERTGAVLAQSGQELQWLTAHPLWLPTPIAPLFKALQWKPAAAAYLLAAVLTDQRVLLHSEDPHLLYLATSALKALITPLQYTSVFIPLLPSKLMSLDEAATLLCDCSTPYLIGCETSLVASFSNGVPAAAVVVDLDRGDVRRAAGTEWFNARSQPFASLCSELQRCMGTGAAFKALRAQGACLRFVVDVLNVRTGFLAASSAPADADALSRLQLLEALAADATKRFEQQSSAAGLAAGSMATLHTALQQSVGGMLAEVCEQAATQRGAHVRNSGGGIGGGGGGYEASSAASFFHDLSASATESSLVGAPSSAAASSGACCEALAHIYAAQPFREWWGDPTRTRASERLQWMEYRSKGVDLIEYLRENHKSMKVLERSLEQRLHAIWAAVPAPVSGVARAPSTEEASSRQVPVQSESQHGAAEAATSAPVPVESKQTPASLDEREESAVA